MFEITNSLAVNTLRLDDKSLVKLFSNLDKRGTGLKRDSSGYRTKPIPGTLGIPTSDAELRPYSVYMRSLSANACIVLIGMYIHPKQDITLTIPTAAGEMQYFEGTIDECVLVMGKYHEARLTINTKIEILEFIGNGPSVNQTSDAAADQSVEIPKLVEGVDELEALLEAVSHLGAGEPADACQKLLDLIQTLAERLDYEDVFEAVQELAGLTENACPDPSALGPLDSAVQSLRSA